MDLGTTDIQLLLETPSYYLFGRDNLVALVEREPTGCGSIGGTGILTERGLAYLVWRDGQALLAGKGFEEPASAEQAAAIRMFSEDLKAALERPGLSAVPPSPA